MKGKIIEYDYPSNRVLIEFEPDFALAYDKYKDKDVNVEIKTWKPKRSGAANRLMWVLVDKIAKETGLTKEEVYRREIREIGGVSDVLLMVDEAVDRFCRSWSAQGIGWQTEVISLGDGRSNVIAYYGSSTFDADQMAQLIDALIFEAEQLGIDTDSPDRRLWWESLMEEYDGKYKNG